MLQITINETGTGTAMQEGNTSVNDYSRRIGRESESSFQLT